MQTGFWATRLVQFENFEGNPGLDPLQFTVSGGTESSICGASLGYQGLRFFSKSSVDRYLQTRYWDVRSGGQWQFTLKYADGTEAGCYALQNSLVAFQYRLITSTQWVTIDTFARKTFMYVRLHELAFPLLWAVVSGFMVAFFHATTCKILSSSNFQAVAIEIPVEAWSANTQFRWIQDLFFDQQEVWILDNIQFFQHFPSGNLKGVYANRKHTPCQWFS